MKTSSTFFYKTAVILSTVGHPLLTISLFVLYVTFRQLPLKNAAIISGLLIGGVIIPISWYIYRKVRQGRFTNFDVSNQSQRTQFYPVLIGLLVLVIIVLFATNQPRPYCYGTLGVWLLILSSYAVNRYIKVSLHTSLSFFLAWAIFIISKPAGIFVVVLAFLIAASRLVLKRHTLQEIVAGALIGSVIGSSLFSIG